MQGLVLKPQTGAEPKGLDADRRGYRDASQGTAGVDAPTSGGGVGVGPAPLPRYKPGDRVHVSNSGSLSRRVWTVRAIDTNRTPVQDHEPAYKLRHGPGGRNTRYAYESDLYPAGDQ